MGKKQESHTEPIFQTTACHRLKDILYLKGILAPMILFWQCILDGTNAS